MSDKLTPRSRKQTDRLQVGEPKVKKAKASSGEKKSKIKKAGGKKSKKDGPKRPLSAYMYFSQEQRASVKAANPDATFGELGKLLSEKWAKTADRKKYEDLAKKDKVRYEKEKEAAGKD